MNICIMGCGLIGNRRAQVAQASGGEVLLVAAIEPERAQMTAKTVGAEWTDDIFLDTRNLLDPACMANAGFRYFGIGRSSIKGKCFPVNSNNC